MSEATRNLSRIPIGAITREVMTLARWLARKAAKAEWHKQGLRWRYLDAKDLAQAADAYLSEHRDELIDRARAQISSDAQRQKP
jgi:uncharacterized protein YqjF (DUF2071 family)